MLVLASARGGCSLSLNAGKGSVKRAIDVTRALSFRLNRPGYRPLHFSARPLSLLDAATPYNSRAFGPSLRRAEPRLAGIRAFSTSPPPKPDPAGNKDVSEQSDEGEELSESPYTIPNALTVARILACPFLGYYIVQGDYVVATSLLFACGVSDWLDGYIARHWGGKSVLGSILDPAADKTLMTTLVVTLAWAGLLPVPLAVLILGRDVGLSLWAFYIRYKSLPPPRTISRYFSPSIPSAEVKPTQISKASRFPPCVAWARTDRQWNTALQLVLMGVTTVSPLITYPIGVPLEILQYAVAGTTVWSGLSYVGQSGFKILPRRAKK